MLITEGIINNDKYFFLLIRYLNG